MKKSQLLRKIIAVTVATSMAMSYNSVAYGSFSDEDFSVGQENTVENYDTSELYQTEQPFDDGKSCEQGDFQVDTVEDLNTDSETEDSVELSQAFTDGNFGNELSESCGEIFEDSTVKILEAEHIYELMIGANNYDAKYYFYAGFEQSFNLNINTEDSSLSDLTTEIYNENHPAEILYSFRGTGSFKMNLSEDNTYCICINMTSENPVTISLLLNSTIEEAQANDILSSTSSEQIKTVVTKLLNNIGNSGRPLSEYNDPVNIAADFSQSPEGVVQAFMRQYGSVSGKNRIWRMKYEEVLVDLLSDESFLKSYNEARKGDLEDFVYSALGEIAEEGSEILTSAAGKLVKIQRSTLQDMLKAQITADTEKICILDVIQKNTDDKNLKDACKNCMHHYFSSSMDSTYEVLVDIAVSEGISKAVAAEKVVNQILSTKLKKSFLEKMVQEMSLGTVGSVVMEILFVKDTLTFLTGIDKRVDSYLKTVSLNFIYEAAVNGFGGSVNGALSGNTQDISEVYILFNFALQVKQEAYSTMPSMYTSKTWKKIVSSDPYLKNNLNMIQSFTISNYKKVALGKLTPKCTAANLTVNLDGKITYPLTGISYLAEKGYFSKSKKIASVTSDGVITGKKIGKTNISCVVKQYGETYKLICTVNVVKPSIKLNKKSATIYTSGENTVQLKAAVKGQSKKVTWKSSNPSVATVSKSGKVTAKKDGTTTITATANGVSTKCTVKVTKNNNYVKQGVYSKTYDSPNPWSTGAGDFFTVQIISSRKIKFMVQHHGVNYSPIYQTNVITAKVKDNKVSNFSWKDSWGNSGTGSLIFGKNKATLKMKTVKKSNLNRWLWYDTLTFHFTQGMTNSKVAEIFNENE